VTDKFRLGVVAATGGIALFYVVSMIMGFFGVRLFPSISGASPLGIGISVVIVIVSRPKPVLDFDTRARWPARPPIIKSAPGSGRDDDDQPR